MMRRTLLLLTATAALLASLPTALPAQIASPGKLSRVHGELEGLRSCTRCHELRQPGVSEARCLECHGPLAARIARGAGFHGRLRDRDCGLCHKEHIGTAADIVRLDTAAFEHGRTGWALEGAHVRAACRDCHRPEHITDAVVRAYEDGRVLRRTLLGATTTCAGCHREDSPHEEAVNRRGCAECHSAVEWKDLAKFDHEATRFPLTGAHREVSCEACHERGDELRLRGLAFGACTDCHRDPHAARFGTSCTQCHATTGWRRVERGAVERRFDHARTGFALRGAHAGLSCARCHDRAQAGREGIRIAFRAADAGATYPRPQGSGCASCHADYHEGAFRGAAGACDRCHGERAWQPVTFDVSAHERTRYPLVGAHRVVPCGACHAPPRRGAAPRMRWTDLDCRACHQSDDPHQGRFGTRKCASCHVEGTFALDAFDHAGLDRGDCLSCHRGDDPHRGQFTGRGCADCHATQGWRIARYPHTAFPLEGAHAALACAACHTPGADGTVRYRDVPTTCEGCHGGDDA